MDQKVRLFDTKHAAEFAGMAVRSFRRYAEKHGIEPANLKTIKNRTKWKWTPEQAEQIRKHFDAARLAGLAKPINRAPRMAGSGRGRG
jgi:hypothetical protein